MPEIQHCELQHTEHQQILEYLVFLEILQTDRSLWIQEWNLIIMIKIMRLTLSLLSFVRTHIQIKIFVTFVAVVQVVVFDRPITSNRYKLCHQLHQKETHLHLYHDRCKGLTVFEHY